MTVELPIESESDGVIEEPKPQESEQEPESPEDVAKEVVMDIIDKLNISWPYQLPNLELFGLD